MGAMSPWHWAIVAVVVLILFGSKKLPDAARGLGRSLRIFKSEVKEMQNDDAQAKENTGTVAKSAELPSGQSAQGATSEQHTEPKSA
ncbi:Sec-independent protein translocase subunit TatA [Rhodococcus sp. NPDC058521]|uniref:Sec-independent protein translocase subunit TatA n=1 Tax=Rhodococcus sp. NPDC058521 TaxID=3346536 RepID=UPI003655714A